MSVRHVGGLRRFVRTPLTLDEARGRLSRQLLAREVSFLKVAERGIYAQPASPYRALLLHAGVEYEDLAALVADGGLDVALERLYDSGCCVALEEFKCRRPIVRGSLRLEPAPHDFDNPLLMGHYVARTGGSRGAGRRLIVDLDLLAHEAAYHSVFLDANAVADRPMALWRPLPPAGAGIKNALLTLKVGRPLERWFTQTAFGSGPAAVRGAGLTLATLLATRAYGKALPWPGHVPVADPGPVAAWLAEMTAAGSPAYLETSASGAVRICHAARASGLDISGTFFRLGGEPYTAAKHDAIAERGARAACHYSMSEAGRLALACGEPQALDDVHLACDKVGLLMRPRALRVGAPDVQALFFTTLLPSMPKLMLNVESGDCAQVDQRDCCCAFGRLGFTTHLHTIRSYEKLTSEGMNYLGNDLLTLIEEVLPRRFGGNPTDYQLVEQEHDGFSRISLLASPALGFLDEREVLSEVSAFLKRDPDIGHRIAAGMWRSGETLRLVRREPLPTASSAKILPLYVLDANARQAI